MDRTVNSSRLLVALAVAALCCPLALRSAEAGEPLAKLAKVNRIVFLGDSITYAGHYVEHVDACLAARLPNRHIEVLNLGLPSETVSGLSEPGHADGKFPRPDLRDRLARVLNETGPDLVIACYGMNDGIYLPFDPDRFQKFKEGMLELHTQVSARRVPIIHATPPTFDEVKGGHAGYNNTLARYSEWLLSQRSAGWDVVDLHGPMDRYLAEARRHDPSFFLAADGIHCDETGHWLMAKEILLHLGLSDVANIETPQALGAFLPHGEEILKLIRQKQPMMRDALLTRTGHKRPGLNPGLPLPEAQAKAADLDGQIHNLLTTGSAATGAFPGRKSVWQGFDRYDFQVNGNPAILVVPKAPLPGNPWAWRGEFFGAFANVDAALVGKGFYLAYLNISDRFGNPDAVRQWDGFYRELTGKYGLAKKTALIGLSRGGLYCYNWAAANPDKVACIYADAPVCDFKSWPGGKLKSLGKGDGSAVEWAKLLKAYGFKSDAEAIAYRGNPVDNLKPLADAGVPLLHVYGEADTVVPWEENTKIVAERYKQLGGRITLIGKPGIGHHPHGLDDPTPIVDFILQHTVTNRAR